MKNRVVVALVGALAGVLIELIAATIQQLPIFKQLSSPLGIGILVISTVVVLVIEVAMTKSSQSASSSRASRNPIETSLKRSEFSGSSQAELTGKGIEMDRVKGRDQAKITINTKES